MSDNDSRYTEPHALAVITVCMLMLLIVDTAPMATLATLVVAGFGWLVWRNDPPARKDWTP